MTTATLTNGTAHAPATDHDFRERLRRKRAVERECRERIAGLKAQMRQAREALADALADLDRLIDDDQEQYPLYEAAERLASLPVANNTYQRVTDRALQVSVDGGPAGASAEVRVPLPPVRVQANAIPDAAVPPCADCGKPLETVIYEGHTCYECHEKAHPRCVLCRKPGDTCEMPSQYHMDSDLTPCDMVDIDLLAKIPADRHPASDDGWAALWLCGKCHGELERGKVPGAKAKKKRTRKAPPLPDGIRIVKAEAVASGAGETCSECGLADPMDVDEHGRCGYCRVKARAVEEAGERLAATAAKMAGVTPLPVAEIERERMRGEPIGPLGVLAGDLEAAVVAAKWAGGKTLTKPAKVKPVTVNGRLYVATGASYGPGGTTWNLRPLYKPEELVAKAKCPIRLEPGKLIDGDPDPYLGVRVTFSTKYDGMQEQAIGPKGEQRVLIDPKAAPPAAPAVGLCTNCGVRLDDGPDAGPGSLCDHCDWQAKKKAREAVGGVCGSPGPNGTACTASAGHTGPHRWELPALVGKPKPAPAPKVTALCRCCLRDVHPAPLDAAGECPDCAAALGADIAVLYDDGPEGDALRRSVQQSSCYKVGIRTIRDVGKIGKKPKGFGDRQVEALRHAANVWLAGQRAPNETSAE